VAAVSEREARDAAPAVTRFPSLGMGLLVLTLIAVLTGIALWPFYSATEAGAHHSVAAMQASTPLRMLRAAHHWASALLILLGGAWLAYGLFTASYRRPLHVAWVGAVCLVLLFFLFQLTGHLLPWDSQAVSTAVIESGIAENVPIVGPAQGRLVRGGGAEVSGRTLTAWYDAHVVALPLLLAAVVALLVAALRRAGTRLAPPKTGSAAVIFVVLLAATVLPAPLGPAATPDDFHSFAAESEWYVLPLHSLLVLAQGIRPDLAFLGTVLLPGAALGILLALPWIDRKRAGEPPSRAVTGWSAGGLAALATLTVLHLGSMASPFHSEHPASAPTGPVRVKPPPAPLDPAAVQKGKALFASSGCAGCHTVAGKGGKVGPPLDGEGGRRPDSDWQVRHLKDPGAVVPGSTMPPYKQLSEPDLRALAAYMASLK
jgi:quinol-cytochrome oxidoreductase complex cytochrome b subunit/cytochrome c2